ncbi:archease [Candidatus Woesearchaeota archaeon]|nr:archease [Candidatus Woesearchaeota archaeon]
MRQPYEFLDHTSEAKFRAYGKTLEEAFANAALATFALMTDISKVKAKKEKKIVLQGKGKEMLLFDFLEHLIFLMDTEGFLLSSVKTITITKKKVEYELRATVLGDLADGYETHSIVKAVTYNDMLIEEKNEGVMIQVVHDL